MFVKQREKNKTRFPPFQNMKMETNNTDGHKQKMPTPSFHKFRNHGPQQNILTNCKTEFKRISTFVQLVLLTVVEL